MGEVQSREDVKYVQGSAVMQGQGPADGNMPIIQGFMVLGELC